MAARMFSTAARKSLRLELAVDLWARMRGLLDTTICAHGEVLMLAPCKSIHTFGMREAIDVAFVDKQGRVLEAIRGLPPCRLASCQKAVCVLERRGGSAEAWVEPDEIIGLLI